MQIKKNKGSFALSAAIAALVGSPASAQVLEEIVVTAQMRQQNMQDVPIAINAMSGDSLAATGINTTEDLGAAVPGLGVTRQSSAVQFYIRGIGTTGGQAGQEGAVATFVDGVYMPSMTGSAFLFQQH